MSRSEEARLFADAAAELKEGSVDFAEKMEYIGMQVETMPDEEKRKFEEEFLTLTKSLNDLRKVLLEKEREGRQWYEFDYYFVGCVVLLALIFALVCYALFRSLTARDRRRQEKLAKKDKSKKKK